MRSTVVRNERGGLTRRGVGLLLILALLLAAGGTGAWLLLQESEDDDGSGDVVATPVPSASAETSPSPSPPGGFLDEPEEYAWGEIHFRYTAIRSGKRFANAYFLAEGAEAQIQAAAEDCVEEFLTGESFRLRYFSASCYGFDSLEALEYADPNPNTGGMANLCWRAFYSKSKESEGSFDTSGSQYEEEGCP